MSDNPYASPTTHVSASDVGNYDHLLEPPFFAVSLPKLLVLGLFTLGFYQIYWFYRNWRAIKERKDSSLMPVLRAIFAVFFCHACFIEIRDFGAARDIEPAPPFGWLAAGWIMLAVLSRFLPNRWIWLSFLGVLFLLPVQSYVNRVNAAAMPGHDTNARFGVLNWACLALGGGMFLLIVIAMLFK